VHRKNAPDRAKADACAAIRHAGDNNTAAGKRSNRGCDPKRPVHGTDWREEQSRSVKSACLRFDLLHFLERSPKTPYGLFWAATITVDEGHGATETP